MKSFDCNIMEARIRDIERIYEHQKDDSKSAENYHPSELYETIRYLLAMRSLHPKPKSKPRQQATRRQKRASR